MGRAGCEIFAREGAKIAAVDIDPGRLDEVVEVVKRAGGKAKGFRADLLKIEDSKRFVAETSEWLGGIDILWAHAGCPGLAGIENIDIDEYQKSIDLNVRTSVIAASEVVPHMRARGGGAIMFTASMAGLVGSMLMPVYSAAKFAVVGLTKSLAQTLAPDNIRVNVVCPGLTDTPMLPQFMSRGGNIEESKKRYLAGVPMARVGRPEEMANAALWGLASDEASYVTGVALPIDGGYSAK